MRTWILALLCIICLLPDSYGQRVLMEEEPMDFPKKRYGRNRPHFVMGVVRWGSAVDGNTRQENWRSLQLGMGLRYKRKVFNFLHFNLDLAYEFQQYYQEEIQLVARVIPRDPSLPNPLPNGALTVPLNDIRTLNHAIELAPTLRFRFSRGNNIGAYLDAGFFGQYIAGASRTYTSTDESDQTITVTLPGYHPAESFSYGWTARLGLAYFNVYWRQRMNVLYPGEQFTRTTVGIEFNLY